MKKLILLSLVSFSLFLTSCSKETMIKNELDGEKWKVVKITTTTGSTSNSTAPDAEFYAFDKDGGKGTMTDGTYSAAFTWSVSESTVTLTFTNSTSYTVTKSGYSKQTWERKYSFFGNDYTEVTELEKQ